MTSSIVTQSADIALTADRSIAPLPEDLLRVLAHQLRLREAEETHALGASPQAATTATTSYVMSTTAEVATERSTWEAAPVVSSVATGAVQCSVSSARAITWNGWQQQQLGMASAASPPASAAADAVAPLPQNVSRVMNGTMWDAAPGDRRSLPLSKPHGSMFNVGQQTALSEADVAPRGDRTQLASTRLSWGTSDTWLDSFVIAAHEASPVPTLRLQFIEGHAEPNETYANAALQSLCRGSSTGRGSAAPIDTRHYSDIDMDLGHFSGERDALRARLLSASTSSVESVRQLLMWPETMLPRSLASLGAQTARLRQYALVNGFLRGPQVTDAGEDQRGLGGDAVSHVSGIGNSRFTATEIVRLDYFPRGGELFWHTFGIPAGLPSFPNTV